MIIGIDFDDVVADSYSTYLTFYNRKHKTSFTKAQLVTGDFARILNIDPDEWLQKVHHFIEHDFLEMVRPMDYVQKTLARLSQRNQLHTVTSRSQRFADVTMRWKALHGISDYFVDAHFCGNEAGNANHREKNDVCKDIGATILLDDHPRNAFRCAADNIQVFVFDQPWNRHVPEGAKIVRINSWQDQKILSLC